MVIGLKNTTTLLLIVYCFPINFFVLYIFCGNVGILFIKIHNIPSDSGASSQKRKTTTKASNTHFELITKILWTESG